MNQRALSGLIAIIALGVGIYLAITIAPPSENTRDARTSTEHLQWYPQARALNEFTLTSHTGEVFNNNSLQNKWTLGFVGYTFCPDICPTTLAEINKIYPALKAQTNDTPIQVWFLSVDPKRDTIERLKEYVNFFNPEFMASTGEHSQLFPLVRSMGMMYSMSESTDNPNYLVDHSAAIVVINPKGQIIGRFKPEHSPGRVTTSNMQDILEDMPKLLAEAKG